MTAQKELAAAAVDLFMSSVLAVEAGSAVIVAQEAATPQDTATCADGPEENTYVELPAKATVLSVLRGMPCFEALEDRRQKRDRKQKRLYVSTFLKRFTRQHGWGEAEQQQEPANSSAVAASSNGGKKGLSLEWTPQDQRCLRACHGAMEKANHSRSYYFRNERGWLCKVPQKGVAEGVGLVTCNDQGLTSHFPNFVRFRQACGQPVTDENREEAKGQWKECVEMLRQAQTRVVLGPGVKLQQSATQQRTLKAAASLLEDEAARSEGVLVDRPATLDLADAMKAGLSGLHDYVRTLYMNPQDFACVEFLCERIRAALDGGAGLEYYNLMQSARQSVNSLIKMYGAPSNSTFQLPPQREEKVEWWQCALTGKDLLDPVLAPDGRSF